MLNFEGNALASKDTSRVLKIAEEIAEITGISSLLF
jgi:hypothetical protein